MSCVGGRRQGRLHLVSPGVSKQNQCRSPWRFQQLSTVIGRARRQLTAVHDILAFCGRVCAAGASSYLLYWYITAVSQAPLGEGNVGLEGPPLLSTTTPSAHLYGPVITWRGDWLWPRPQSKRGRRSNTEVSLGLTNGCTSTNALDNSAHRHGAGTCHLTPLQQVCTSSRHSSGSAQQRPAQGGAPAALGARAAARPCPAQPLTLLQKPHRF